MTDKELREIVAENLIYYRNLSGMTQLQLAEYLNYSDKSVSKWENADGMPDVYVLQKIAELYCIGVSDLVTRSRHKKIRFDLKSKLLVILCAVGLVWVIATAVFVIGFLAAKGEQNLNLALAFVYAVPASGIVLLVLASVWKKRITAAIGTSIVIWGLAGAIWITLAIFTELPGLWALLIIAAAVQILAVLWDFLRGMLRRTKNAVVQSIEKSRERRAKSAKPSDKSKPQQPPRDKKPHADE